MSDWIPVVIAGLASLVTFWPPATIAKKVTLLLLFVFLASMSAVLERHERAQAHSQAAELQQLQKDILAVGEQTNAGVAAMAAQPRPLPAFQIGEMGLQFSNAFPGEWRPVPWSHPPVFLDWAVIQPTESVFLELQVRFGSFNEPPGDRGVKFRLRESDSNVVAGESEWIKPAGSPIDPPVSPIRVALRHPGTGRRYVLEALGDKSPTIVTALGVLSR